MPKLTNAVASPQRPREELEAYRAALPEVQNDCGHFAVSASDYYSTGRSTPPGGGKCVDCYRELQREGHRRRRGEGKFLTIEDIRNPERKSGFDHVHYNDLGRNPQSAYLAVAYGGSKDASGKSWRGPRRATAEEAAQDYCDYMNEQQAALSVSLNTPGHARRNSVVKDHDPEVEAALGVLRDARAQRRGRQGYVYCVGAVTDPGLVKIGYSVNPEARVGELQTGNGRPLSLLAKFEGTRADEKRLHAKYIKDNTTNEWFRTSPALLAEFGLDQKSIVGEQRPEKFKGRNALDIAVAAGYVKQ